MGECRDETLARAIQLHGREQPNGYGCEVWLLTSVSIQAWSSKRYHSAHHGEGKPERAVATFARARPFITAVCIEGMLDTMWSAVTKWYKTTATMPIVRKLSATTSSCSNAAV